MSFIAGAKFDKQNNQAQGGRGRGASWERKKGPGPSLRGKGKPPGEYKDEKWPQVIIISLNSVESGGEDLESSSASPNGKWGYKFCFSKTLCQLPPALSLPENSNPSPFTLSPLSYAMFRCIFLSRFPSGAHISATCGKVLLSIRSTCRTHVHLLVLT